MFDFFRYILVDSRRLTYKLFDRHLLTVGRANAIDMVQTSIIKGSEILPPPLDAPESAYRRGYMDALAVIGRGSNASDAQKTFWGNPFVTQAIRTRLLRGLPLLKVLSMDGTRLPE